MMTSDVYRWHIARVTRNTHESTNRTSAYRISGYWCNNFLECVGGTQKRASLRAAVPTSGETARYLPASRVPLDCVTHHAIDGVTIHNADQPADPARNRFHRELPRSVLGAHLAVCIPVRCANFSAESEDTIGVMQFSRWKARERFFDPAFSRECPCGNAYLCRRLTKVDNESHSCIHWQAKHKINESCSETTHFAYSIVSVSATNWHIRYIVGQFAFFLIV